MDTYTEFTKGLELNKILIPRFPSPRRLEDGNRKVRRSRFWGKKKTDVTFRQKFIEFWVAFPLEMFSKQDWSAEKYRELKYVWNLLIKIIIRTWGMDGKSGKDGQRTEECAFSVHD